MENLKLLKALRNALQKEVEFLEEEKEEKCDSLLLSLAKKFLCAERRAQRNNDLQN